MWDSVVIRKVVNAECGVALELEFSCVVNSTLNPERSAEPLIVQIGAPFVAL